MAETANIAEMATRVAKEIFGIFGWTKVGPQDANWPCVCSSHGKKTHPSDGVFWYDDPYAERRIYLNVDFKSYARGSLSKASLAGAVSSLVRTTECANLSSGWKGLYLDTEEPHQVSGLLFIYNHDSEYDEDFASQLDGIDVENFRINRGLRAAVFGPTDVAYLATIANDIIRLRGLGGNIDWHQASFFYPDLILSKVRRNRMPSASIEQLLGSWVVLVADNSSGGQNYIVYYKEAGRSADEFKYLFDFFFRYQMLGEKDFIEIRAARPDVKASAAFEVAQRQYAASFPMQHEITRRLEQVKFVSITQIVTRYCETEIGMQRG